MSVGRDRNGSLSLVKLRAPDGFKTRASEKKNRGAFEIVRERDKNDPTKRESHTHARIRHITTSASNTKSKASSTKSKVPSTESKMPSVETQELVLAVYLASRCFDEAMIQELVRQRVCEAFDPDIAQKVESVVDRAGFCEEGRLQLPRVDKWLNEHMSYKELVELTKIDDYVQQSMEHSEQNDFPPLEIAKPSGRAGRH